MKKALSILLCVCITLSICFFIAKAESFPVSVGDHIYYGHKNQTDISWEVLSVEGNKALLFCDYIIDIIEFGTSYSYNYNTSSLKKWCDSFFLSNSFDDSERAAICEYSIGNMTDHHIFVLSIDEFNTYINNVDDGYKRMYPGVSGRMGAIGYSTVQITDDNNNYWLRSQHGTYWIDLVGYQNGYYGQ